MNKQLRNSVNIGAALGFGSDISAKKYVAQDRSSEYPSRFLDAELATSNPFMEIRLRNKTLLVNHMCSLFNKNISNDEKKSLIYSLMTGVDFNTLLQDFINTANTELKNCE